MALCSWLLDWADDLEDGVEYSRARQQEPLPDPESVRLLVKAELEELRKRIMEEAAPEP